MPRYRPQPYSQAAQHDALIAKAAREALSVAEAAAQAGISRTFLYERIASGELATIKLGKRRLIRVEALRRWLERLEARSA